MVPWRVASNSAHECARPSVAWHYFDRGVNPEWACAGSTVAGRTLLAMPDGFLIIDKPLEWTSFDVVARVRRLTGERRIGHAGTLDPLATGVLPLALGQATRFVEYLSDASKAYDAVVHLGVSTTTYDREGPVTQTADPATLPD